MDVNVFFSGWWFQPLWKILISWDYFMFPIYAKNKKCSKPPTSFSIFPIQACYMFPINSLVLVDVLGCKITWNILRKPERPMKPPYERLNFLLAPHELYRINWSWLYTGSSYYNYIPDVFIMIMIIIIYGFNFKNHAMIIYRIVYLSWQSPTSVARRWRLRRCLSLCSHPSECGWLPPSG